MKIFISTADHSGDFHASRLAAALKEAAPGLNLCGVGGPLMEAAGVKLAARPAEKAVVGFFEVVRSLPAWRDFLDRAAAAGRREKPDLTVLVDSPSFNIRLARRLAGNGGRFVYYISPQVWAWGAGRVREIARLCREVLVIFPFETEIYRRAGVPVRFVGHPFLDEVRADRPAAETRRRLGLDPDRPLLLLLPGSRESEVRRLLPVLAATAAAAREKIDLQTVLYPARPGLLDGWRPPAGIRVLPEGDKYSVFAAADLALAASGSVTLELTLLGVPFILLYRLAAPTYWMLRPMLRVRQAGITNILAGRTVAPEFLQGRCRPELILPETLALLGDPARREEMKRQFLKVRESLGEPGAARRAARRILELA
ncbi:MAG TPA: lipid-A-disaccharide synthase [bacterium]|uniref:Lipid-A-disaccharide synthase n=1 Tax=candidate division TA06 bacterium ADurb.Bin417 TaxID=1852828 RepID=A0A1V5MKW3_UNCT6|nr:MAG: Lipid-A-disaccharide synthase [candidate division TA06 bacterium ADurb.Bin417]HNQ35531.1 lipid-A-disaccharide synthase [bacterium]HNS48229.1 lipid-A-disaccharide synthase [bacterium]